METIKLISAKSNNNIYMERQLNLDNISTLTKSKIRKAVGIKTTKGLIKEAIKQGVNLGTRKETQEKRAFLYFGDIYNNEIEERNKIISGFLALIFVRIALKSVALLLVAS